MSKLLSAVAATALMALPAVSPAAIVINEIMYDPVSTDNQANTEYVELYNTDSEPVDLANYRITAGSFLPFTFPEDSIIPGNGYVLLQSFELDTLISTYSGGIDHSIVYRLDTGPTVGSKLANASGVITLFDADNNEIDKVSYAKTNGWPASPNGAENRGHSLELINPLADNSNGANWRVSYTPYGTPGTTNSTAGRTWYTNFNRTPKSPTTSDPIVFSVDVMTSVTLASVDLYLESHTESFTFTPIPMADNGAGNYSVQVGPYADNTLLRYYLKIVDSEGFEAHYPALAPMAHGVFQVKNAQYTTDDFVINEIMINPTGTDNEEGSEYVEIFNKTNQPIDLSYYMIGRTTTDSYWRQLSPDSILPANGYMIIAGREDVFSAEWGTTFDAPVSVVHLAWRRGGSVLVNSGSSVFLADPNQHNWEDQWENITAVPFQQIDFPLGTNGWPTATATTNISMELRDVDADPTVGSNWRASAAPEGGTPGAPNSTSSVTDWSVY